MSELPRCPFCGGVAEVDQFDFYERGKEPRVFFKVECVSMMCAATGPKMPTVAAAILAFTRPAHARGVDAGLLREAREMMKDFNCGTFDLDGWCCECGGTKKVGHINDCRRGALLARIDAELGRLNDGS